MSDFDSIVSVEDNYQVCSNCGTVADDGTVRDGDFICLTCLER